MARADRKAAGTVPFPRPSRGTLRYVLLSAAAFVALLPFLYMIANALKTYAETVTRVSAIPFDPRFWPAVPQWKNFVEAWLKEDLGRSFVNSIVISAVTLAGAVTTSSLAAYAFAKLDFPGKETLFTVLLFTLMIPETVTLIPNFIVISRLGWVDRLAALTLPFMASAFYIFLLRQFFSQIPEALLDAARLDGCSNLRILLRVVLPLARAPLFTVAFLDFTTSWNSLQWPLVATQSPRWRPISVGLSRFIGEAGPETQLRLAGAIIALFPIVLIYLAAQKQITEAIAATGINE